MKLTNPRGPNVIKNHKINTTGEIGLQATWENGIHMMFGSFRIELPFTPTQVVLVRNNTRLEKNMG
jgi:hypothetical protein